MGPMITLKCSLIFLILLLVALLPKFIQKFLRTKAQAVLQENIQTEACIARSARSVHNARSARRTIGVVVT